MRLSKPVAGIAVVLIAVVAAFVWMMIADRRSQPYEIARAGLSGWTIVEGASDEPWLLALRPPDAITTSLFRQIVNKSPNPVLAPPHIVLPLVLRDEYDEGLQGVYGIEALKAMARDAGIESATMTPVCVAHHIDRSRPGEIVFVPFSAPEFQRMRQDFVPPFPEHAGTGVYDPATLTPVLLVASSDPDISRWWPLIVDEVNDCQAPLMVE